MNSEDTGCRLVFEVVTGAEGDTMFDGACAGCGLPIRAGSEADLRARFEHHVSVPAPPALVSGRAPRVADVDEFPEWFLNGRGYRAANSTRCPHGIALTSFCERC